MKVLFLALVYVFNFTLFEFLAAILEKAPLDYPASVEQFSVECHETNKPIVLASPRRHKQHNKPIRIQRKYK